MSVLENEIEKYFKKQVEKRGWICWKFVSPGTMGVPDRIVIGPKGQALFVELKRPDIGGTSKVQRYRIRQLRNLGHLVCIVNTKKKVDVFVKMLEERCDQ